MTPGVDLLASYWTISAGLPHTDREYSPFDFKDRVQSAARAGFKGFGIWHADLEHVLEKYRLDEMRQILADNGIQHVELHQLLLEDERVRVLHTRIAARDVVPLHTHRWGGVAYLLSFSYFIRRDEMGEILFDSRQAGDPPKGPCAQWMQPLPPHTVQNLGPLEISILDH